jgi:hypothetical protein
VGKEAILMEFDQITACLDMAGCPNRCLHCWIGHGANGRLGAGELRFVAEAFRPFAGSIRVESWYREPDFLPEYRALWALENELSSAKREMPHWELMSVWRAVRDEGYIPWLQSLGLKEAQLTLFGGREMTDRYTGRRGAFDEILRTIKLLLAAKIAPRIQVFVHPCGHHVALPRNDEESRCPLTTAASPLLAMREK